jgi:hypothetical protein
MANILHILLVSPAKTGTAKGSGKPYSIVETHCALLNEDGSTAGVGMFVLGRDIPQDTKAGYYMPVYGMRASTYGDSKGVIVAEITGLTPLSEAAIRRVQGGPPATPAAPAPKAPATA